MLYTRIFWFDENNRHFSTSYCKGWGEHELKRDLRKAIRRNNDWWETSVTHEIEGGWEI